MGSNGKTFKTIVLEDGACAVVRTDPSEPSILQVVAVFYDAARARRYADMENGELFFEAPRIEPSTAPQVKRAAPPAEGGKAVNGARLELTERQSAALEALRAKADDDNLVEIKGADLAEAASIPLGSVHSVIQSLEKKKCILTTRPGTSHAPAVYQVLSPGSRLGDVSPVSLQ